MTGNEAVEATGTRPDARQESSETLPTVPASLENLLLSNDAPSDADIPILRGLHTLFSAQLMRLDDEIASLLSSGKTVTVERLKEDCAVLLDRWRQLLGALSAIRRFPEEVLQEIFFKLIPDEDHSFGFPVLDPSQGAWLVSRVCRRWRAASQCPRLWTTFRITFDDDYISGHHLPAFMRCKNPVALLRTALRYSGSCKLNLHVDIWDDEYRENRRRVQQLFDVLMAHSERWARVSLVLPNELGLYLSGVRGRVPQLKRLSFVGCDPVEVWETLDENELPVIRAFEAAPQLKQVSVRNALLRLNYPLLTSFTSKSDSSFPHRVPPLFVIEHCPNLVHMDDYVEPMGDIDPEIKTAVPRITSTSLTHLVINDPTLLACLSLPALLSLDVGDMNDMSCLPFIPPFLDASQCSLTKLYFRNSMLSGTPLAHILELVPCLTDLGILSTSHTVRLNGLLCELIKNLSEVEGADLRHRLVPQLESIAFETKEHYWTFVGPELVDMLCSRVRILRKASFRLNVMKLLNVSKYCRFARDQGGGTGYCYL